MQTRQRGLVPNEQGGTRILAAAIMNTAVPSQGCDEPIRNNISKSPDTNNQSEYFYQYNYN
jgi:hypothetical protein